MTRIALRAITRSEGFVRKGGGFVDACARTSISHRKSARLRARLCYPPGAPATERSQRAARPASTGTARLTT
jgi:hypothetical protein